MIEAGDGGQCNIICTQPRRIAVSKVTQYGFVWVLLFAVSRFSTWIESISLQLKILFKFATNLVHCNSSLLYKLSLVGSVLVVYAS